MDQACDLAPIVSPFISPRASRSSSFVTIKTKISCASINEYSRQKPCRAVDKKIAPNNATILTSSFECSAYFFGLVSFITPQAQLL